MRSKLALPFVLSGFAGLVYEIAWARMLRVAFGGTSEAIATVLAAFMAGLAIGAVLGGRLADKRDPRSLLVLFARIELAIGAFSLLSIAFLHGFPEVYAGIERALGTPRITRILAAILLLLPPTVLMGMTMPVLVRACVALGARASSTVAALYSINTLGAVLGALSTGILLLPLLGVSKSVALAAFLDVLAALLVLRAARSITVRAPDVTTSSAADAPVPRSVHTLLLASAAISGTVALGLEVLWTRTLVLTVGSSTQAFALMLATFLGGLALGSALYARLADRLRAHALFAGLAQLAIAVLSVTLLNLANVLPYLYVSIWESLHVSTPGLLFLRVVPAIVLMLVPTMLMGANLPLLIAALARRKDAIGREVGLVYGANTAGAIAGSLLAGLVLLPRLGVAHATSALAWLGLLGACAALCAAKREHHAHAGKYLFAVLASALALLRVPEWNARVLGRGLAYMGRFAADLQSEGTIDQAMEAVRVLYYRDGAESSVLVYDNGDGTLRPFVVNGRCEASNKPNDMRNQYLLGHLPALLHRGPVRAGLVIALGSGMTAGCLARHAEHVTVVELEPAVLGAAAQFAQWNHGVLEDPKVQVVIDDGRHFLLTTSSTYDVITVDPIHPSVAGSDTLYSVEQYRLVQRRLAPGGVAAQWLPLYSMGVEDARAITRTFFEVFPDATIWANGEDAVLIGGTGDTLETAAELKAKLYRAEVALSLAAVREARLATFLSGYVLGPPDVERYVASAPVLRDDRPIIELSLPWQTYEHTVERNMLEIARYASGPPPSSLAELDPALKAEVEQARAAFGFDLLAMAQRIAGDDQTMQTLYERALELYPEDRFARLALGR